jgi:hypothetical protein
MPTAATDPDTKGSENRILQAIFAGNYQDILHQHDVDFRTFVY